MWAFEGDVYLWSGLVQSPDAHCDGADMWVWRASSWHLVSPKP